MRMKKHIILFLAGMLALAGCNKEIDRVDNYCITINASIGAMTKVADTGFADGDRIAVYAWTGDANTIPDHRVVDGVVNTFDGSRWTPVSQMLWKNTKDEHYFLGISPVRTISDFTDDPFALDPADYDGSDLLVARNLNGLTLDDGAVDLQFNHLMARLNVNLKFPGEWDAVPEVNSIIVKTKTKASVNYLSASVTPSSDDAESVEIPATAVVDGYDKSYSVLQIPQDGVRVIVIIIGERTYMYESPSDIPLSAGKYTTLGLTVGRESIELADISVSNWEEAMISEIEAIRDPSLSWETENLSCEFTYDNNPITIKLERLVADNALVVPITLTDESGLLSLDDATVSFAAGEFEKTVSVSYDYSQISIGGGYSFSLSFDEELGGPGRYVTVACAGYKLLEYEDYREGYYSGRWQVDSEITHLEWVDGPIVDDLDSDIWILQRAKGTTDYYKMILWDGLAEIEFRNPGDGTFDFQKTFKYNEWVSKFSGDSFVWDIKHKGNSYQFDTRPARSEIVSHGQDFLPGDYIELEGWGVKNGTWLGYGHIMYQDFVIIKSSYTVSIAGTTHGSVVLVGNSPIEEDATVTLTVTPEEGYRVERVYYMLGSSDKVYITLNDNNEYTFKMPAGNITIYATFLPITG